jgi:N-acetylglucosaminyl-diphospho-decaprenol L-rhamnosyltransferase
MDKLVVVVVSWNTSDLTRDCLTSLYAELGRIASPSEVWVVDNASQDDSVSMIRKQFPEAKLIENKENVGFARANNQALRQADGSLYLLLNSDTVVAPGAIERMMTFLRETPEAAAAGPKLILGDGSIQRSIWPLPSVVGELRYCLGEHFFPFRGLFTALFAGRKIDFHAIFSPRPADAISAACLMIRRSVFEQIGYLAEEYFLFSEENDFFFRMRQVGLRGFYLPEAHVVHLVGQSRKQRTKLDSEINFLKSRLIYFQRSNRRSLFLVRLIYGVFLGWSALYAQVFWRLRGRRDTTYVELYRELRRTLAHTR